MKFIVLDRVDALQEKHEHILDGLVIDILGVLSRSVHLFVSLVGGPLTFHLSPDMEVRRKAVNIALKMVSSRNVEDVVAFFKKQLVRTVESEQEKVCIHRYCCVHKGF